MLIWSARIYFFSIRYSCQSLGSQSIRIRIFIRKMKQFIMKHTTLSFRRIENTMSISWIKYKYAWDSFAHNDSPIKLFYSKRWKRRKEELIAYIMHIRVHWIDSSTSSIIIIIIIYWIMISICFSMSIHEHTHTLILWLNTKKRLEFYSQLHRPNIWYIRVYFQFVCMRPVRRRFKTCACIHISFNSAIVLCAIGVCVCVHSKTKKRRKREGNENSRLNIITSNSFRFICVLNVIYWCESGNDTKQRTQTTIITRRRKKRREEE